METPRPAATGTAPAEGSPLGPSQPRLLDQLRAAIRVRHYSLRTEQTYVDWVRRYVLFHGKRHPREMGAAEINAFLSHLAADANVAARTHRVEACGPRGSLTGDVGLHAGWR